MLAEKEKNLLDRYVAGNAAPEEIARVESSFVSGELDPHLRYRLKEDWKTFKEGEPADLSHILDRIHHKIHLSDRTKRIRPVIRLREIYFRVAAVILIPLLLAGSYYFLRPGSNKTRTEELAASSTIVAPLGSRISFNLPDGSFGFLNSGSSLSFSVPFATNRVVTLEGEAWFEIGTDREHPFLVNAGTSQVKVTGTRFNLSSYPGDDFLELVLEEGSVEFMAHQEAQAVKLEPSDRLTLTSNSLDIEKTDPEKYSGWTQGQLIFRGDNMKEVARRIERWYNINIEIAHKELESYVFVGTFEDDSLEEVLQLLGMTSRISYTIIPRHQRSDNTWEKEKVILTKGN